MKRRGFLTGLFAMACAPFVPKLRTTDEETKKLAKAYFNQHLDRLSMGLQPVYVRRKNWEGTTIPRYIRVNDDDYITFIKEKYLIEQSLIDVFELDNKVREATGKFEWPKSS